MPRPRAILPLQNLIYRIVTGLLISLSLLIGGCGAGSGATEQSTSARIRLETMLDQALQIGMSHSDLTSIFDQKKLLDSSSEPFELFDSQPATRYHQNLTRRYQQLTVQTQRIITTTTQKTRVQAQRDLQHFEKSLVTSQNKLNMLYFQTQYRQNQQGFSRARFPRDYSAISESARTGAEALDQVQPIIRQMDTFGTAITAIQKDRLDTSALQKYYTLDQQKLNLLKTPDDAQKLQDSITAQQQQLIVSDTLAIPYLAHARLNDFQLQITQLKQYGVNVTKYQQKFQSDQQHMQSAHSRQDFQNFSPVIMKDMGSMRTDLLKMQDDALIKQFHQEVKSWTRSHMYHDPHDRHYYAYTAGYQEKGTGGDLDTAFSNAQTANDFRAVQDLARGALLNFEMLKSNFEDHTPSNQPHKADQTLINYYKLQNSQVMVISMTEQTMRIYNHGKLQHTFSVTTGRYERPSEAGMWKVLDRKSPFTFVSDDSQDSPFYYEPSPVSYAIQYEVNGYFIHDAPWRNIYGPGTQFPHPDAPGAETGSHGCINLARPDEKWIFNNTGWDTTVIVY